MTYIFWVCVGLIAYTYLIYPVLLIILDALVSAKRLLWSAEPRKKFVEHPSAHLPSVSHVFAAFNEQAVMAAKMENCRTLDYPSDSMETLIGCDGCTDQTANLARTAGLANTKVLEFHNRSGKPAVLNRVIMQAQGEIVVFSDANTTLEPQSIRNLLKHFADPDIGCVCGTLRLRTPETEVLGEGLYWRYETHLKTLEGRLNMLVGANGGIYAISRSLFSPLPQGCIVDDFVLSMTIRARGHALAFEPTAVAYETAAPSIREEFGRHARIGAGNFQSIAHTWSLLSPFAGRTAFAYWSHKILRWFAPFAMIAAFVSSVALYTEPFYRITTIAFVVFGLTAALGYWQEGRGRPLSFGLPYHFLAMNVALLIGFFRFLLGSQSSAWQRTMREDESR